eukprot:scaffold109789_cov75-Phaeocystis_antarctica.AAC.2
MKPNEPPSSPIPARRRIQPLVEGVRHLVAKAHLDAHEKRPPRERAASRRQDVLRGAASRRNGRGESRVNDAVSGGVKVLVALEVAGQLDQTKLAIARRFGHPRVKAAQSRLVVQVRARHVHAVHARVASQFVGISIAERHLARAPFDTHMLRETAKLLK